jgi:hypothetical protein
VLVYYKANTIIIERQLEIAVNRSVGVYVHHVYNDWCLTPTELFTAISSCLSMMMVFAL